VDSEETVVGKMKDLSLERLGEAEYVAYCNGRADAENSTNFRLVMQFHWEFHDGELPDSPTLPSQELMDLRTALILEETEELLEAYHNGDIVEMADAIADLLYVVYGAADTFGIDADVVFKEVHRSNMTKLGADGLPIYREDGKILKGPGFEEPKIAEVLGI